VDQVNERGRVLDRYDDSEWVMHKALFCESVAFFVTRELTGRELVQLLAEALFEAKARDE
jgi:hypothetical protein